MTDLTTYITLLRAINVGGRFVTMERLRGLFAELGLGNVRSFIQSGNVFFETFETDRAALAERIEAHLKDHLGYPVSVVLRTVQDVESALALEPFRDIDVTPDVRLCVVYLAAPLAQPLETPLQSPKGDMQLISRTDQELFIVMRLIDGRPGNLGAFVEKRLGVVATVRFWDTSLKILMAAKA